MIKFQKPNNLNGSQLRDELQSNEIILDTNSLDLYDDGEGGLWLNIADKDSTKAKAIIDAHTPKPVPEPTIVEKLASVGLNLDDLKVALGL